MNRFRHKKRQFAHMQELPLTPLVDMALTLLIVFMIASQAMHNGIKIDLPQGGSKDNVAISEKITLIIDKLSNVYLGKVRVDIDNLSEVISIDMLHENKGLLFIQADQALAYGVVFDLIERLKRLQGVKQVVLSSKNGVSQDND